MRIVIKSRVEKKKRKNKCYVTPKLTPEPNKVEDKAPWTKKPA